MADWRISRATALLSTFVFGVAGLAGCATHSAQSPTLGPPCAWNLELSPRTLGDVNVAAPDTAASYWTLRYTVQPGLTLTVKGRFPDARYFSFNTYDSGFSSFTNDGVESAVADYRIAADPGSANPWGQSTATSGSYTVNVRSGVKPGQANALPLAPADTPDGATGYLILRTYLPAGGPASVELPTVTFATPTTSRTVAPCTEHNVGELPQPGDHLPRAGTPLPNQQPSSGFYRRKQTGIAAFPNADAAYLRYVLAPPGADQVLVVRGKAPRHPVDDHPAPWPQPGFDVRYWSLCSYPAILPVPVTRNRMPDGSYDDGCRDDSQTKVDAQGSYTYVVGTESLRAQIDSLPSATFVPLSSEHAQEKHLLVMRHLLANNDFKQAVQNVPPDASPDQCAAVMGDYYPQATSCALSTLVAQGITSCG